MTSTLDTPARARDDDDPRPGRRLHPGIVAAVLAVALGVAGLVAGATPSGGSAPAVDTAAGAGTAPDAVVRGDITVSGVYVREPASPDVAAAYLSIRNSGRTADSLESAYAGAAKRTTLHGQPGVVSPGAHADSGPVAVPAGGGRHAGAGPGARDARRADRPAAPG